MTFSFSKLDCSIVSPEELLLHAVLQIEVCVQRHVLFFFLLLVVEKFLLLLVRAFRGRLS